MRLGNGFKHGREYKFEKSRNGLYKLKHNGKTVYKTYVYKDLMNYFDNIL